jgi:hypothetical protein
MENIRIRDKHPGSATLEKVMLFYVVPFPSPEVMRTLHVKGPLELPGALQLTRVLLLRLLLSRALVVNIPRHRRRRNKPVLVAGIRQAGVIVVRRRGRELVVVSVMVSAWIVHIIDAQELMMMTGVILVGGAGTGTRRRNDGRNG